MWYNAAGCRKRTTETPAFRRGERHSEIQAERTPPFQGCAFFYSPLRETVPNFGAVFYFCVDQEVEP